MPDPAAHGWIELLKYYCDDAQKKKTQCYFNLTEFLIFLKKTTKQQTSTQATRNEAAPINKKLEQT